ncbi:MAG TPA: cyclic nucleotide-binding domain-containing protein [Candidatus Methylacidiphilales bacterium]|nr:cyclic nucleotide-binding domain-containing protein [Candidatus Methylacidiphilales bacterium]
MSEELSKPTLPTFSWIGQLNPDDRDLLSSYGEFFPAYPGTAIINEGDMQTSVFVVISGSLEVCAKQEDETELLLARVGAGETLGEISLFDPGPAAATVRASEFSQIWRIADEDLIDFMEENPGAGNVLLRTLASILAQRLRQINPRAFGLSTYAIVAPPEPDHEAPLSDSAPETSADTAEAVPVTVPATTIETAEQNKTGTEAIAEPVETAVTDNPPPQAAGAPKKRVSTKTTRVPDPDELEPLV